MLGDVNNDTIADIIIGAPYAGTQSSGITYIVYGQRATKFVLIDLGNLSPNDGYAIYGKERGDCLGLSVSDAGYFAICYKIFLLFYTYNLNIRRCERRWI